MCYVVMKRNNTKVLFFKKPMDIARSYTDRYPSVRHAKQGEKDIDKHRTFDWTATKLIYLALVSLPPNLEGRLFQFNLMIVEVVPVSAHEFTITQGGTSSKRKASRRG
jgi:hypothetical protein